MADIFNRIYGDKTFLNIPTDSKGFVKIYGSFALIDKAAAASGWSQDFNGVVNASISKINGIALASIAKVNGV